MSAWPRSRRVFVRTGCAAVAAGLVFGADLRLARAACDARGAVSTCLASDALVAMPGPARFAYLAATELPLPGRVGASVVSTFQREPVVLDVATPGPSPSTRVAAVDRQLGATLTAEFGVVDRVAAYAALPATLYETGAGSSPLTGRPTPATSSLRDPRAGAGVAIVRRREPSPGSAALTAYADVQIPTHATTDFSGEKGIVVTPTLAGDLRVTPRVLLAFAAAARLRSVPQSFAGEKQGSEVIASLGMAVDVVPRDRLTLGVEAQGILGLSARSDVRQSTAGLDTAGNARDVFGGEWLATARTAVLGGELSFLGGAGGALPGGGLVGVGQWRAVLGVAYAPRSAAAPLRSEPSATPPRDKPIEPAPTPLPVTKPVPPALACHAVCRADAFSPLPPADEARVADQLTPFLTDVRACLDRIGAQDVRPAVLVRFTATGELVVGRIDVDGHEDMACVKDARARIPGLRVSRGTTVRCELRCP